MSLFSTRLRELRGAESQTAFAAALGMNRVQYAKYESGKNSPSVDVLAHLCRIHAVSADWLLGLSDLHASVPPHEVKAGANSAVAIGSNAQASVSFGEAPACSRCPYKKRLAKIEKMLGK